MTIQAALPLSTTVLLGVRGELGFDWLPGAGVVLTPQLGVLVQLPLSDTIGFSLQASIGRLLALSAGSKAALFGSTGDAVTIPLSLQVGLAIGL